DRLAFGLAGVALRFRRLLRVVFDQVDRALGAVLHRQLRLLDHIRRHGAIAPLGRVAQFIDLEQTGRKRVATVVPLALLAVYLDFHLTATLSASSAGHAPGRPPTSHYQDLRGGSQGCASAIPRSIPSSPSAPGWSPRSGGCRPRTRCAGSSRGRGSRRRGSRTRAGRGSPPGSSSAPCCLRALGSRRTPFLRRRSAPS